MTRYDAIRRAFLIEMSEVVAHKKSQATNQVSSL